MKTLTTLFFAIALTLASAMPASAANSAAEAQAQEWAVMFSKLSPNTTRFMTVGFQENTHTINNIQKIEASGKYLIVYYHTGVNSTNYKAVVFAENVMLIFEGPKAR